MNVRARSDLKLHRIWATCDINNVASAGVMEKIGMQREGHFRQDMFLRGEWRDSYLYALLEDEFRSSYTASEVSRTGTS